MSVMPDIGETPDLWDPGRYEGSSGHGSQLWGRLPISGVNTSITPPVGTPNPETPTSNPAPTGQKTREAKKGGRDKKSASAEEKVPLTISVSPSFARKVRIVSQGLDESLSAYV